MNSDVAHITEDNLVHIGIISIQTNAANRVVVNSRSSCGVSILKHQLNCVVKFKNLEVGRLLKAVNPFFKQFFSYRLQLLLLASFIDQF
jgi:hypothetical protein